MSDGDVVGLGHECLAGYACTCDSADELASELDAALAEVVRLRAREQAVRELLAEYRADDERHLAQFGQHHPVAGIAADHLAAVLDGEQP